MKSLDLSIIILNYNTKDLTKACLSSIKKNTKNINYEIILIDNASKDGSKDFFKALKEPYLKFISNNENKGFTGGNNQGLKLSKARYCLLLNSDTLIKDNVIGEMISWMDENKKVGISSCALRNKDGSLQGTGGFFPNLMRVFSWMTIQDLPLVDLFIKPFHPMKENSFFPNSKFYNSEKELDWLTGAFLMVRREVVKEIGFMDEDYFMYGEDLDFCYRAKQKGWKIYFLPFWSIIHYGGKSSSREFPILSEFKSLKIFYKKHMKSWQFPFLIIFLKLGAFLRMGLKAILGKIEEARIYGKAFNEI